MIAVIGRDGSPGLAESIDAILNLAGDGAIFSRDLRSLLPPGVKTEDNQRLAEKADVFVSLGGDGTLLRTAHWARGKPLAGVNLGYLGFLTVYSAEDVPRLIRALLDGDFSTEDRFCLEVERQGRSEVALNDVTLVATMSHMLGVEIAAGGDFMLRYRGDGLIVSTPTGSTAYNLAAGGPILHPDLAAMVITPICAHSLTVRPIVMSSDTVIEVRAESRGEGMLLSADGRESFLLDPMDTFTVRMSQERARFVRTSWAPDFFEVLRKKLEWG